MQDSVERAIVAALEEEIEQRIKAEENGPWFTSFGLLQRAEAMSAILGRAIQLAKEKGVSAYDLALYFADACSNKGIKVAKDAWFECRLRYGEIEFYGCLRSTWGKL